jgi:hypothetical protein
MQHGGTCEDAERFGFACGVGSADAGIIGTELGTDGGTPYSGPIYRAGVDSKNVAHCYNDICTQTLEDIISTGCAASLQETPCLCGATDTGMCLAGMAAPTGPLVQDYEIGFSLTGERGTPGVGKDIQADFVTPLNGSGQANALVQCVAAFGCTSCLGATAGDGGANDGGTDARGPAPDAGRGAVDGGETTQGLLSAQSPDCLSCAQSTGCLGAQLGGACEDVPGQTTLYAQQLSDGKMCADVMGSTNPWEADVCLDTLGAIFKSPCVPTPQDPVTLCLSTATGLVDLYICAFNAQPINYQTQLKFVDRSLGAGQANALAQCLAASGCANCFPSVPDAGAPGADAAH